MLVVDNGNPPGVVAALESWAAREPRLRLVSGHGNTGFGAACNLGARQGSGEFLLLVNRTESFHRTGWRASWSTPRPGARPS